MPGVGEWLERGCAPGSHQFAALPTHGKPVAYVCLQCGRQELPAGQTCMICDQDGVRPTVLTGPGEREPLRGRLCGRCFAEFDGGRAIFGWTMRAEARAAEELGA